MWLLIVAVIALLLKLLDFPRQIEELSWWWIAALFAAAFVWFEFVERWLGLDKKRVADEYEDTRQARLKRQSRIGLRRRR